jgi:hippurate hydrolase
MAHRKSLIDSIAAEAAIWRRTLHQNPQTMYEETFASGFVAAKLAEWGIPHETGIGKTGIAATIDGQSPENGRAIAFRADIDALDIEETTGLPWASQNKGKMHACGHDGHTATILALGRYLQQTKNFHGRVRLIFQPAEEGGRGAERMVSEGLLERFPFDEIYGFHNFPYLPLGRFWIRSGFMMAATDFFSIHFKGRGGHAAMPSLSDDLVLASAHLVTALQGLISREVNPQSAAVLSVTNLQSGTGASNVLPSSAFLSGTVRCFDAALRDQLEERMRTFVRGFAQMYRLEHTFTYDRITDAVFNPAENVEYSIGAVEKLFGPSALYALDPIMGGEDFGYFLQKRPGSFIFAGQAEADPASPHNQGLHTPGYDFNDAVNPLVVDYFAELAETRLAAR